MGKKFIPQFKGTLRKGIDGPELDTCHVRLRIGPCEHFGHCKAGGGEFLEYVTYS
jgi:hypothetical protein